MYKRRWFAAVFVGLVFSLLILISQMFSRPHDDRVSYSNHMTLLGAGVELYRLDNHQFPSTEQGLEALISLPTKPPIPTDWSGPYIKNLYDDPWGRPYRYQLIEDGIFDIYSFGEDNKRGGSGFDADLSLQDHYP